MSRQDTNRNVPAEDVSGPIKPGSVLHRILEIVARRVAKRLADDASTPRRPAQQNVPRRSHGDTTSSVAGCPVNDSEHQEA